MHQNGKGINVSVFVNCSLIRNVCLVKKGLANENYIYTMLGYSVTLVYIFISNRLSR